MASDRQAVRRVELEPMMGGQLATVADCDAPGGDYVSLSDLQREIATVRQQGPRRSSGSLSEELEGMYQGGYQAALLDLIDHLERLGIDLERKD